MFDLPLSDLLKQETKVTHQQLEKSLVKQLRLISNREEYASLLQLFYSYFGALEERINKFVLPAMMKQEHDFQRRKTNLLAEDIIASGGTVDEKCTDEDLPEIKNTLQSFGALYVIEGSTLGGRVICKMLQRQMDIKTLDGFTFFNGYGDETEYMWGKFRALLNAQANNRHEKEIILQTADETFAKFQLWIAKKSF